ncbi:MAG: Rieske 2Fe-2S domain-containing protein, partial [Chloroflexi bacterium]
MPKHAPVEARGCGPDTGAGDPHERRRPLRPRRHGRRARRRGPVLRDVARIRPRPGAATHGARILPPRDQPTRRRACPPARAERAAASHRQHRGDGHPGLSEFVPVAREDEVPVGEVKVVHARDKSLCLGHCDDGTWGAIDNVCTHDGGVLGEGELEDCLVECPRHGARFDLLSGEVRALPAVFPVNAYPVRVIDGVV